MQNAKISGSGTIGGGKYDQVKISGSGKISGNIEAKELKYPARAKF